jgi:phage shock protein C
MQRIIQINISGRLIPIEEDAYFRLRDYIQSLKRRFTGADGEEIISDIENRIAELFLIRLQGGTPAIDSVDVGRVVAQLGDAGDLGGADAGGSYSYGYSGGSNYKYRRGPQQGRLRRDPFDKVVGGVCSGIAHYFDIDPVIIRLVWVVTVLTAGVGLIAYFIACAVIPAARSREEVYNMSNVPPSFQEMAQNMADDLHDLKRRGEQMSRELRDFFGSKK